MGLKETMVEPFERSIYMVFDYAEHDLLVSTYRQSRHGHGQEASDRTIDGRSFMGACIANTALSFTRGQATHSGANYKIHHVAGFEWSVLFAFQLGPSSRSQTG